MTIEFAIVVAAAVYWASRNDAAREELKHVKAELEYYQRADNMTPERVDARIAWANKQQLNEWKASQK